MTEDEFCAAWMIHRDLLRRVIDFVSEHREVLTDGSPGDFNDVTDEGEPYLQLDEESGQISLCGWVDGYESRYRQSIDFPVNFLWDEEAVKRAEVYYQSRKLARAQASQAQTDAYERATYERLKAKFEPND